NSLARRTGPSSASLSSKRCRWEYLAILPGWRSFSRSNLTFPGGSCLIPRALPLCSLSRWLSVLSPAPSVFGSPSRWTRRKHSRRRVKTMAETHRQAVVRVEGLSKYFGQGSARVNALLDINLEVYPGQVVGLMGPSGSGKTTLLNCIACILEPSRGRITLDGEVVYDDRWLKSDLRRLRLDKIGFIFQYPNLLPFLDG